MVAVIGRGEHFAFVNVVSAKAFQNARLDNVPDADLRHHRNAHGLHDAGYYVRIRHAGYATGLADIRRHTFQGHDCTGSCLFSYFSLLRRSDIHDNAAFQHFGKAVFKQETSLFHILYLSFKEFRLAAVSATKERLSKNSACFLLNQGSQLLQNYSQYR